MSLVRAGAAEDPVGETSFIDICRVDSASSESDLKQIMEEVKKKVGIYDLHSC